MNTIDCEDSFVVAADKTVAFEMEARCYMSLKDIDYARRLENFRNRKRVRSDERQSKTRPAEGQALEEKSFKELRAEAKKKVSKAISK